MGLHLFIGALVFAIYSAICWLIEYEKVGLHLVALDLAITVLMGGYMFASMGVMGGVIGLGVSDVFSTYFIVKNRHRRK